MLIINETSKEKHLKFTEHRHISFLTVSWAAAAITVIMKTGEISPYPPWHRVTSSLHRRPSFDSLLFSVTVHAKRHTAGPIHNISGGDPLVHTKNSRYCPVIFVSTTGFPQFYSLFWDLKTREIFLPKAEIMREKGRFFCFDFTLCFEVKISAQPPWQYIARRLSRHIFP